MRDYIESEAILRNLAKAKKVISKLSKVREWLTVSEAAQSLSMTLQGSVEPSDIYQLVGDRQLTMSVRFVNYEHARRGEIYEINTPELREACFEYFRIHQSGILFCPGHAVDRTDDEWDALVNRVEAELKDSMGLDAWQRLDESSLVVTSRGPDYLEAFVLEKKLVTLYGVYDLYMSGGELVHVEREYARVTNHRKSS